MSNGYHRVSKKKKQFIFRRIKMNVDLDKREKEEHKEKPEMKDNKEKQQKIYGKEKQHKRDIGIGIDVGTGNLIVANSINETATFKLQRDAFFDVENNVMTKNMLKKMNAPYIESEDGKFLYTLGQDALNLSSFFNKPCRRPLARGCISTREQQALIMIKLMLKALLGDPAVEGEPCYFSVPAQPVDEENFNVIYHENILKSFISSYGYKPTPMNEGLAVVWGEMDEEEYSGLAMSWGCGMVNCCLSFMGMSEKEHQFSIARGGDWIDENAAKAIGLENNISKMTMIKEAGVDLLNPKDREQTAVKIYYENLIRYVCTILEKKLNRGTIPNFTEPITVVVSGGTSKAINFEKLFEEELRTKSFPFRIKTVKKAKDQLNAVARGCLLNALNSYDD